MGTQELLIVAVVIILLFGSTKLPQLARSLGQAQREFKKGQHESQDDEHPADAGTKKIEG